MGRALHNLKVHVRFVVDYVKANFLIALEYRASFLGQILSMMLNDAMWVAFWWIYFTRFQVLQGGWQIEDVLALWAVTAVAVAFAMGFFGNSLRIAEIISQGGLDYYLVLPKNVLLHVLVSRMDVTGWGDLLFGTGVFVFFLHPTPERTVLFVAMAICGAAVFLAFNIFWQSLAFWLGNAEGLAFQLWNALITFSTYPPTLFRGLVKGLLFTAIPATFLSHVPVQLLRELDPAWLFIEVAFAAGALIFSVAFFYRGLRRYESGNLMTVRA
jgi:ABC-2 type transport system permease protein